jgi:hypothetical protein
MSFTARLEWNGELDDMADRIARMRRQLLDAIRELAEVYGARIKSAAQEGAPWTDRTTQARGGLSTKVEASDAIVKIILFHTATYGIWLEIRWGGKYATIAPTLTTQFPALMAALQSLIG